MTRVDFCITTFKRPRAIERLILSIGEHYPQAAVHIGDQNKTLDHSFYHDLASRSGLVTDLEIHHLDFDCGLSVARNYLVTSTPSEYKLILEDDFVFTEKTDVGVLVKLLDGYSSVGVVGGGVRSKGREYLVRGKLQMERGTLAQIPDKQPFLYHQGVRYSITQFVANFALMRKEMLAHVQWDPALKIFEHTDFYIRIKDTPYAVFFTPDAIIDHPPVEASPGYSDFRQRHAYMTQMLRKHGLSRMEMGKLHGDGQAEFDGMVIELRSDGSLDMFMEKR